ncbi:MAG: hypothetical protein ABL964_09990 [Steroidobacteraceae bacterium]
MAFWRDGFWKAGFFREGFWAGMGDAEESLQDLLDPGENFQGVLIIRRMDTGLISSYYCIPINQYPGRSRWIDVTTSWSNAQKAAAIRAALEIPSQPDSSLIS